MIKRLLIIAILLAAVGAGTYAYFYLGPERDPNMVRVSSNIEVTDVEVSFRMPGWVEARPASEGKLISESDIVARRVASEQVFEAARSTHEAAVARP